MLNPSWLVRYRKLMEVTTFNRPVSDSIRPRTRPRGELNLRPAAAKRLDELDGGDQPLAGQLGVAALGLQRLAIRVHHLEIADDARAVAFASQVCGPSRV